MSKISRAKTVLRSQPAPRIASFSSKGPNALTPEILKVTFQPEINIFLKRVTSLCNDLLNSFSCFMDLIICFFFLLILLFYSLMLQLLD